MRTTRRLSVLVTALLAVVSSAPAHASPEKVERTVVGRYDAYPAPVTGCNSALGPWACMIVPTRPTERFVTVKVRDTHGLPVYFRLRSGEAGAGFCGETRMPVSFAPGRDLEIEVGVSGRIVQTDCPASSVKTTGTITVTLSNVR